MGNPTPIASTPLGADANLTVTEQAGAISIVVADPSLGLSNTTSISAVALLKAWAAAPANAELQAILTEGATLLAALP